MPRVSVVGTIAEPTALKVFGHDIAISRVAANKVGQRVEIEGYLCYNDKVGAYLQAVKYEPTDAKDSNLCVVTGKVVSVLKERKHQVHQRTVGIILQQSASRKSRVLITVVGAHIQELDVGNLSAGQELSVRGYINYHRRGLHVNYKEKAME